MTSYRQHATETTTTGYNHRLTYMAGLAYEHLCRKRPGAPQEHWPREPLQNRSLFKECCPQPLQKTLLASYTRELGPYVSPKVGYRDLLCLPTEQTLSCRYSSLGSLRFVWSLSEFSKVSVVLLLNL